jgi:hypothetical protein
MLLHPINLNTQPKLLTSCGGYVYFTLHNIYLLWDRTEDLNGVVTENSNWDQWNLIIIKKSYSI